MDVKPSSVTLVDIFHTTWRHTLKSAMLILAVCIHDFKRGAVKSRHRKFEYQQHFFGPY